MGNHNGAITHLEPDILECEDKWGLWNITVNKSSGGDGVPTKLFQILKNDAIKVLHSLCQQTWKTQQWPEDWKRWVFISIPKDNAKECSNNCTSALISHAGKVKLKILQVRFQQYVTEKSQMVNVDLEKAEEPEMTLPKFIRSQKKRIQKNIYFCYIDYAKAFVCITTNRKILKEMGMPSHFACLLTNLYAGQEATITTRPRTMD